MLSSSQTGQIWESETAVLSNVTRQNAGLYQCTATDLINYEEVHGNATLEIHCEL